MNSSSLRTFRIENIYSKELDFELTTGTSSELEIFLIDQELDVEATDDSLVEATDTAATAAIATGTASPTVTGATTVATTAATTIIATATATTPINTGPAADIAGASGAATSQLSNGVAAEVAATTAVVASPRRQACRAGCNPTVETVRADDSSIQMATGHVGFNQDQAQDLHWLLSRSTKDPRDVKNNSELLCDFDITNIEKMTDKNLQVALFGVRFDWISLRRK